MRPKSDLPSSYYVKVHLHNKFVKHMKLLKEDITVRNFVFNDISKTYLSRQPPERYPSLKMDGQQTQQGQGFRG